MLFRIVLWLSFVFNIFIWFSLFFRGSLFNNWWWLLLYFNLSIFFSIRSLFFNFSNFLLSSLRSYNFLSLALTNPIPSCGIPLFFNRLISSSNFHILFSLTWQVIINLLIINCSFLRFLTHCFFRHWLLSINIDLWNCFLSLWYICWLVLHYFNLLYCFVSRMIG